MKDLQGNHRPECAQVFHLKQQRGMCVKVYERKGVFHINVCSYFFTFENLSPNELKYHSKLSIPFTDHCLKFIKNVNKLIACTCNLRNLLKANERKWVTCQFSKNDKSNKIQTSLLKLNIKDHVDDTPNHRRYGNEFANN